MNTETIESIECECGGTYWEKFPYKGELRCPNCYNTRDYTPRSPSPKNGTTKSQHDALQDIFRFFFSNRPEKMKSVEYEHSHCSHGPMEVFLKTNVDGNAYTMGTYQFFISRRGKITVTMAEDGLDDRKEHVAKMVGGHVRD